MEDVIAERKIDLIAAQDELEQTFDIELLKRVADYHAQGLWGEKLGSSDPIPLYDHTGSVTAYLFSYALGVSAHPSYEEIAAWVQELRVQRETQSMEGQTGASAYATDFDGLISRFGSVTVSATRQQMPVLRASHYLHPYFAVGDHALRVAQEYFEGFEPVLDRLYFLGLHEEYAEFSWENKNILVNLISLQTETAEEVLTSRIPKDFSEQIDERQASIINAAWYNVIDPKPVTIPPENLHETNVITFSQLIPIVNWTWWCVPTAYTMVIGYWDNHVKGVGTTTGYGRLFKYWFDHPKFHNNVPNFMDELIDPTTGSWRNGYKDFDDFIQQNYNYQFKKEDIIATAQNDWAWNDIKGEVDNGRPLVWSSAFYWSGPHATTAFGYRETKAGKFIILYNTYGTTASAQREEVVYTACSGIGRVLPAGGTTGQHMVLSSPSGGETAVTGLSQTIEWFSWGNQITKADIYTSVDGGNNWTLVKKDLPVQAGKGSYKWQPSKATAKARIRIEGRTNQGDLIAADGSRNNFKVSSSVRIKLLEEAELPIAEIKKITEKSVQLY